MIVAIPCPTPMHIVARPTTSTTKWWPSGTRAAPAFLSLADFPGYMEAHVLITMPRSSRPRSFANRGDAEDRG